MPVTEADVVRLISCRPLMYEVRLRRELEYT